MFSRLSFYLDISGEPLITVRKTRYHFSLLEILIINKYGSFHCLRYEPRLPIYYIFYHYSLCTYTGAPERQPPSIDSPSRVDHVIQ